MAEAPELTPEQEARVVQRYLARTGTALAERAPGAADGPERGADLSAKVEPLHSFVERYVPPVRWAIEGWWPAGAKGFLGGLPKSFKSALAVEMAVALTHGSPFLGLYRTLEPPEPVLYLQEENEDSEHQASVEAVLEARGIRRHEAEEVEPGVWATTVDEWADPAAYASEGLEAHPPGPLDLLSNAGFCLLSDADMEWLSGRVEASGYRYLFLDPLYRLVGGEDLLDARTVQRVAQRLDFLKNELGCSPVVVHHAPKATDRGPSLFGSIFWRAWYQAGIFPSRRSMSTPEVDVEFEFRGAKPREAVGLEMTDRGSWREIAAGESPTDARLGRMATLESWLAMAPESSKERLEEVAGVSWQTLRKEYIPEMKRRGAIPEDWEPARS